MDLHSQRIDVFNSIQECLITSCLNGGSCLPDKEKQTFSCSCQPFWTGDRCEVKKGTNQLRLLLLITHTQKITNSVPTNNPLLSNSSVRQEFKSFNQKNHYFTVQGAIKFPSEQPVCLQWHCRYIQLPLFCKR